MLESLVMLFFGLPIALAALFVSRLGRYRAAKKENAENPGTHTPEELKKRKTAAILWGVAAGVLAAVVIGFLVLLGLSIAYM